MSKWREPIIDRTAEDVKNMSGGSLDYQKGALNADDLNRIEDNYKFIVEGLAGNAMPVPHSFRNYTENEITYTNWQEHNLPWLSEINRIRANYNALVRLFLRDLGLPTLFQNNYLMFSEVNNWERIAMLGKERLVNMQGEYRRCNAYECGGSDVDWMPYEKTPVRSAVLGVGVLGKMMIGKEE